MITTEELIKIKRKIEVKKEEKIKTESLIELIEKEWENKYGFLSVDDAEDKVDDLEIEMKKNKEKLNTLTEKIENLVDWSIL